MRTMLLFPVARMATVVSFQTIVFFCKEGDTNEVIDENESQ